jgi:hypothetical protein
MSENHVISVLLAGGHTVTLSYRTVDTFILGIELLRGTEPLDDGITDDFGNTLLLRDDEDLIALTFQALRATATGPVSMPVEPYLGEIVQDASLSFSGFTDPVI